MTATAQALTALQLANEVRLARAELAREIRSKPTADGALAVIDILNEPTAATHSWLVYDLLRQISRFGRSRVLTLLLRAGVSETRRVGSLTERERRELLSHLVLVR